MDGNDNSPKELTYNEVFFSILPHIDELVVKNHKQIDEVLRDKERDEIIMTFRVVSDLWIGNSSDQIRLTIGKILYKHCGIRE